jgi:hypothetical protein
MVELGVTEQPVQDYEMVAGVDIMSRFEVWDVGVLAERSLVSDLSFEGATSLGAQTYDLKTVAQVLRFVVDPDEGMQIKTGEGEVASLIEQPGYYLFLAENVAVYEPDPSTVD